MNPLLALLAPLALLVPVPGPAPAPPEPELAPRPVNAPPAIPGAEQVDLSESTVVEQVRIEQRVIVRIAPPGPALRSSIAAEVAAPVSAPRFSERKIGKCVPVAGIAAVQPSGANQLLLLMRDRRLISASLEKACRARDFYSGFYIERSGDGKLCVDRDKLHSRAGANCEISRMRQLVADED
jgi:hypothetical protein